MSHHNGATVSDVPLGGWGRRTLHGSEGRGPAGWGEEGGDLRLRLLMGRPLVKSGPSAWQGDQGCSFCNDSCRNINGKNWQCDSVARDQGQIQIKPLALDLLNYVPLLESDMCWIYLYTSTVCVDACCCYGYHYGWQIVKLRFRTCSHQESP